MPDDVKRRDLFRLTAGGLLVAGLGRAETPAFFSAEEFAAVDELMETIIPTDSHSPGAKAAGCAAYVDRQLAESTENDDKKVWREGVRALMARSKEKFDKPVAELTPDQRITLLEEIAGKRAASQNGGAEVLQYVQACDGICLLQLRNRHSQRDGIQGQRVLAAVCGN